MEKKNPVPLTENALLFLPKSLYGHCYTTSFIHLSSSSAAPCLLASGVKHEGKGLRERT